MKPLTRCPQCRYSLKGLPADHRCPECGFEYDAETAMWVGRLDRKEIFGYVIVSCWGIWMFLSRLFATPTPSRSFPQIAALILVGGAALFVLYPLRQISRSGDAVCTTRQGVWIKKGRRIELYHWAEIEGVFWNSANKSAGLDVKGRTRPLYISSVFRNQTDFEELRMAMRRRKQVAEEESCSDC